MISPRFSNILLTTLPIFLLLLIRLTMGSYLELRQARQELRNGAVAESVLHATRAVRWYFPGNPLIGSAVELAHQQGEIALQKNQNDLALEIFRQLRSSLYAIRSFYQPYVEELQSIETKMAVMDGGNTSQPPISKKSVIHDPKPFWAFLATSAFILWVIAVILLIRHGFTAAGTLQMTKQTATYFVAVGFLFFIWLFGLWHA